LNQKLGHGETLTTDLVRQAVEQLVDEDVPADLKAAFLTALARKGETVEERSPRLRRNCGGVA